MATTTHGSTANKQSHIPQQTHREETRQPFKERKRWTCNQRFSAYLRDPIYTRRLFIYLFKRCDAPERFSVDRSRQVKERQLSWTPFMDNISSKALSSYIIKYTSASLGLMQMGNIIRHPAESCHLHFIWGWKKKRNKKKEETVVEYYFFFFLFLVATGISNG